MAKVERQIWMMPEDQMLPFVAAWRIFERSLNPAFWFVSKCGACKKVGTMRFVQSVKAKHTIIGMECAEKNCGVTLKFEKPLSYTDDSFPDRLVAKPKSGLKTPGGRVPKPDKEFMQETMQLVFDE